MKRAAFAASLVAIAMAGIPVSAIAQDAETPPPYVLASQITGPVADAYFEAYMANDWDAVEPMLADDASFADDTAALIFGRVESDGREAMMKRFREGYASLTHMRFETTRRFVSSNIAVYEGSLDWGMNLGEGQSVSAVTPMVVILTVEGGKIVKHRDFVDYAPFLAAIEAQRE